MRLRDEPEPERLSAVHRMMQEDAERYGDDYVRGLTDKPPRREPVPERQPIFERPTGPHDFDAA